MCKTKILFLGLFLAVSMAGNAYSRSEDNVPSLFITPNSSSGYQVAGTKFLPDMIDSENGWAGRSIPSNSGGGGRNDCSAYTLTSCPSNAICSPCPFDVRKVRFNSCKEGYVDISSKSQQAASGDHMSDSYARAADTSNGSTSYRTLSANVASVGSNYAGNFRCVKESCSSLNSSYLDSIPANNVCDQVVESGLTCYKNCRAVSCNGYTHKCDITMSPSMLNIETCPDCLKSSAKCSSTNICKVTCKSGYKFTGNGCDPLDDNCPDGHYKTCETGVIESSLKYTEKGSKCYQCKPKAVENMKVNINFARSCPAGLSFKFTPAGEKTTTCSTAQCYEYDLSGKPYAPDGNHTSGTDIIVTVGTQIAVTDIPSNIVTGIKSVSKGQTYTISGTSYTFTVNDSATVIAGVGQNTSTGLGAYDYWTLQCKSADSLCRDAGYKPQSEWISAKPTAANDTIIPSTMLANFMKKVFSVKSAMALSPALTTWEPSPIIDEPGVPITPSDPVREQTDIADLDEDTGTYYEWETTATCPYDSSYVKGKWVKKDCPSTCRECTSATTCTKCKTNYSLLNGQCQRTITCQTKFSNCSLCDADLTKCELCNAGYDLQNGKCVSVAPSCSSVLPNCETCDTKYTICTKCESGYSLRNGTCTPSEPIACSEFDNCSQCSSTACTKCKTGYDLSSGHCCETGYTWNSAKNDCQLTTTLPTLPGTSCAAGQRPKTCNNTNYCCASGQKTPCDSGYSGATTCFAMYNSSGDQWVPE